MFKTRLYWFKSDESDTTKQVDREHKQEGDAHRYAAERSSGVAGGCYVLRGESIRAHYRDGEVVAG